MTALKLRAWNLLWISGIKLNALSLSLSLSLSIYIYIYVGLGFWVHTLLYPDALRIESREGDRLRFDIKSNMVSGLGFRV